MCFVFLVFKNCFFIIFNFYSEAQKQSFLPGICARRNARCCVCSSIKVLYMLGCCPRHNQCRLVGALIMNLGHTVVLVLFKDEAWIGWLQGRSTKSYNSSNKYTCIMYRILWRILYIFNSKAYVSNDINE